METHPTWLEINLSAVEHNTRHLLKLVGVPLMAVLKANAYGMGSVEIGRAALAAGATWLAVARYSEARPLRQAGIDAPILVLGYVTPEEVEEAIAQQVSLTLYSFEMAEIIAQRAGALGTVARVHLKVDTGLRRLGIEADQAVALAQRVLALGGIQLEGVYSHLAMVDEGDFPQTGQQTALFRQVVQSLAEAGIHPRWVHLAGSSGAIYAPETRFNLVRPGCALVGIPSRSAVPLPAELRPVISWKARLAACKSVPAGQGIGYGHQYTTLRDEFIGVLPVGYSDGFRRLPGNLVLIGGQKAPVVGKMCMDMCMLRLPRHFPTGEEVVLLGSQGKETISIEDLIQRWNISETDIVSNINLRVPRIYTRD